LSASRSRVRASGPESVRGRRGSIEYRIRVPSKSDLSITAVNGPISVADVAGTMSLETQNGPLDLTRLAGAVQARAQNGPLSVQLSGERWEGKGLDAETDNGPVSLLLPERYSARLETGTINGPWDVDYKFELNSMGRHHLVTKLGNGGPPIRVVTTNGPFQ